MTPAPANTGPGNRFLPPLVRVGVFTLLAIVGMALFPVLLMPVAGYLVAASLGTFAAAAAANAVTLRIYERGRLADIGMGWTAASRRNLSLGVLGGMGAGAALMLLPMLARASSLEPSGDGAMHWPALAFLTIALLFGAAGEEMLFRGYAFQVLLRTAGPYTTVLPMGVLFGAAHVNNQNVTMLGIGNTMLWGVLLGAAFLRSGDLWLPIGLHFGWNWTLPLLGANLSGFTMVVTGHIVRWRIGEIWSGGAYGPEGGLLTTAVVAALALFLWKAPIAKQEAFLLADRGVVPLPAPPPGEGKETHFRR